MRTLLSTVRFLVLLLLFLSQPHGSHSPLEFEEFRPLRKEPSHWPSTYGEPCACHSSFLPSVLPHKSSAANLNLALLSSAGPAWSALPPGRVGGSVRFTSCSLPQSFCSFTILQYPAIFALAVFFGFMGAYRRREIQCCLLLAEA